MAKVTATAKKPKTPEKTEYCVYIGPGIRGVIQSGSIHAGNLETVLENLKPAIDRFPLISGLIVPGEQLPELRIQVKTPGNGLYESYRRLVKAISGY